MGSSKNDKERKVFDVHVSKRNAHFLHGRNIIDLKPKFRVRHPLIFISAFFALLIILFVGIRQFSTRAEVQDLYPTTCLGNWQNVANAEGVPETLNASSPSFSPDNSAAYDASGTEIYCGGFLPPSFATSGQITNVGLTLVWQIGDAPTSSATTVTTITVSSTIITASSSDEDVVTSTTSTVSDVSSTPDIATASSSDDATDTSGATTTDDVSPPPPTPTPTPTPDSTTDSSSTSFIRQLIPFAFADDADSGTISAASTTSMATTTAATSTMTMASDTDASNTAINAVEQPAPTPDDNFLDVSYSTDGQTWISVGEVNMSNWQQFTITLPISDWTDLQNLQIRVEGIPTTQDPVPPIYLDGMLLEVHYDVASSPIQLLSPPVPAQVASTTNQEISPPPPRMTLVSSGAQQSCDVQPFSQKLPLGGTATFTVNLHPSISGISYNLLIGDLPLGISAGFGQPSGEVAATSSLTLQAETSVTPGSLNIPVVYQEHEENGTTLANFCQLNIDVK